MDFVTRSRVLARTCGLVAVVGLAISACGDGADTSATAPETTDAETADAGATAESSTEESEPGEEPTDAPADQAPPSGDEEADIAPPAEQGTVANALEDLLAYELTEDDRACLTARGLDLDEVADFDDPSFDDAYFGVLRCGGLPVAEAIIGDDETFLPEGMTLADMACFMADVVKRFDEAGMADEFISDDPGAPSAEAVQLMESAGQTCELPAEAVAELIDTF